MIRLYRSAACAFALATGGGAAFACNSLLDNGEGNYRPDSESQFPPIHEAGPDGTDGSKVILLGSDSEDFTQDPNQRAFINPGDAHAFLYRARDSGNVTKITIWLAGTPSGSVQLGLYRGSSDAPLSRMAWGTVATPNAGWNTAVMDQSAAVVRDGTYWIAVLAPHGQGRIDHYQTGGPGERSMWYGGTNLSELPPSWTVSDAKAYASPIRAYAEP